MSEFKKVVENFELLTRETPRLLADYEKVDVKFINNELTIFKGLETEEIPESLL